MTARGDHVKETASKNRRRGDVDDAPPSLRRARDQYTPSRFKASRINPIEAIRFTQSGLTRLAI